MSTNADLWLRRWLRRIGAPSSAAPILELGCGTGDTFYLLGGAIASSPRNSRTSGWRRVRRAPGAVLPGDLRRPLPLPTAACLR